MGENFPEVNDHLFLLLDRKTTLLILICYGLRMEKLVRLEKLVNELFSVEFEVFFYDKLVQFSLFSAQMNFLKFLTEVGRCTFSYS